MEGSASVLFVSGQRGAVETRNWFQAFAGSPGRSSKREKMGEAGGNRSLEPRFSNSGTPGLASRGERSPAEATGSSFFVRRKEPLAK